MSDYRLGQIEAQFADIIWKNQPLASSELVRLSLDELNWKKSTTYTVLRRLCERGIFVNDGGTVKALISREEFYSRQSTEFVEDSFKGSLPAFLAAFTKNKSLSQEDVNEIRRMIDSYEEG
ncbi:MAG: BlaI/MecI/CopY family transcriptional regulator [Ruminococcus sp.]|nr:BlaI/MecI/CopY family transcriptional regulator [Ruminococcus sp.]